MIDVWKDRSIFEAPIQRAIESRLDGTYAHSPLFLAFTNTQKELDKARGAPKSGFSGSPFGSSSVPSEFSPLIAAHQKTVKLSGPLQTTISSANQEYDKQMDPNVAVPSAPVYAARLNGLLKTLANAESAVAECVKAREHLVSGLEKLLDESRSALEADKSAAGELLKRKAEIEDKKQQVEVAIMRALGPTESNGQPGEGDTGSPHNELDRPEMEALTPPQMEDEDADEPVEASETANILSSTEQDSAHSFQSIPVSTNGSNKRRRVDDSEDFPDLGGDDGIEPEVAEMLKDSAET